MPLDYTEEFKKKIVEEWLASEGESKEGFARKNGISARSLGRWLDKYVSDITEEGFTSYVRKTETDYNMQSCGAVVDPSAVDKYKVLTKHLEPEITYVGTASSITLYRGSDSVTVSCLNSKYQDVVEDILTGNLEEAWEEANYKEVIEKWSEGGIDIDCGLVTVKGFVVNNCMTDKLLGMMEEDPDQAKVFARFVENLMEVGDQRIVDELYEFLKHNDIKLNEDGSFTGYKAVRQNYKDKFTGKIDNSPGSVVRMPRSLVNDNKDETCSSGLHVGSLDYASKTFYSYGDRVVSVKVWPCNVVSVPVDYNGQKLRACEYEVLEDITQEVV